jgi:hypothetical protein
MKLSREGLGGVVGEYKKFNDAIAAAHGMTTEDRTNTHLKEAKASLERARRHGHSWDAVVELRKAVESLMMVVQ